MHLTFHLTPAERWAAADPDAPYEAPSLGAEGFIHCTDGEAALLATANRHYRHDPRGFLALTIDLDRVDAPWRIEDAAGIYPHVHVPIDRAAILAIAAVERDADGRFTRLGAIAG